MRASHVLGFVGLLIVAVILTIQFDINTSVQKDLTQLAMADRVIKLPEDGQAFHLSIFVSDNWRSNPRDRQIIAWFESNKTLVSVKAQSFFHIYTPSDKVYKSRFSGSITKMPCILFQDSTGKAYYKVTAPKSEEEVATAFATLFDKRPWLRTRPWLRPRPCPCPSPGPGPGPEPITPGPDKLPELKDTPPMETPFPWVAFVLILGGAGVCMGLLQWRKRTH